MDHTDLPLPPLALAPQPSHPDVHLGTTLLLCHGSRPVRVLTLPPRCGKNSLLEHWEDCFGEEIASWFPWREIIPGRPVDLN